MSTALVMWEHLVHPAEVRERLNRDPIRDSQVATAAADRLAFERVMSTHRCQPDYPSWENHRVTAAR
jgi:hypothetical protein